MVASDHDTSVSDSGLFVSTALLRHKGATMKHHGKKDKKEKEKKEEKKEHGKKFGKK